MAKGDDAVRKKKNKAIRRKLGKQNDSSSVSAKVASIIAAKKRRKSGTRRMCQGMCFSLPTPDDPFNDRHGKEEMNIKVIKKKKGPQIDEGVLVDRKSAARRKDTIDSNINPERAYIEDINKGSICDGQKEGCEDLKSPSKFLVLCLNSIENALHLQHDHAFTDEEEEPLYFNSWGIEFWKYFSVGKDIMESSGNAATTEQIAWMVSGAADIIASKEEEGTSFTSPFLLFVVPSQEKAAKVRSVCKHLKPLGIHTVSIHAGASLDHQIQGLKKCEPEFLVSTPERLLELVSLKAIDISGVSMLVVDGLNSICSAGQTDMIISIRKFISGVPRVIVFNDSFCHTSIPVVRHLLTGPIHRLSLNNSITSLSSSIIQSVQVCTSKEEKLSKVIQALDQSWSRETRNSKLVYIMRKDVKCRKLVTSLKSKGCTILDGSDALSFDDSADSNRRPKPAVSMIDMEYIFTADIGKYDVVVLPSFVPSMDSYVHILTRMARHSVNGVLHSFLTKEDAEFAGPLVEILEQCGQAVPTALQDLRLTSNTMEE